MPASAGEDPIEAMLVGGSGFVRKHAAGTELVRAIRKAAAGGTEVLQ